MSGAPTGWAAAPRSRPTNGLAVASLVIAVLAPGLAFVPFAGLVPAAIGLVLGILGVRRAKVIDSGQEVAVAGAVLSGISLLLAIAVVVLALVVGSALVAFVDAIRSSTGGLAPGDPFEALELPSVPDVPEPPPGEELELGLGEVTAPAEATVGECFDDAGGTVPCDQPHLGEVFAVLPVAESADCNAAAFEDYVGTSYGSSRYFTGSTTPTTLEDGGDGVACSLYVPGEQLTGSVRGRAD